MKTKKNRVVPKLRFPEFRDGGDWKIKALSDIATFHKGKGVSKADISDDGKQPCIRYGELYTYYEELIDEIKSFTDVSVDNLVLSQANDVIIPASGETQEDISTASCVTNKDVALGGDLNIVRSNLNGVFLSYYLNSAKKNEISKLAQGISVVHLYSSQLKKLNIAYPEPKEQQKIADCLISLDTLIKAESEQLDTLKEYKAGLLQQLFPAEGETTPKLRFAEFKDDGGWEEVKLVDLAETSIGLVTTMTTSYVEKGIPLIRNSDIKPNAIRMTKLINLSKEFADKYENKKLLKNDIVTVHTGDIGVSAIVEQDLEGSLGFATLNTRVTSSNVSPEFVCWFFNSSEYKRFALSMATGDGRNNFNLRDFNKTILFIPDILEQQKIVDCLSSLDNLIQAKDEKIKMLKEHKQGLMQQLFPVMDDK